MTSYSIKAICAYLEIPPDTLRKWETRYGLVAPRRAENLYRTYSTDDLIRLRRFLELKRTGLAAAEAAAVVKGMKPSRTGEDELWTARIFRSLHRFDERPLKSAWNALRKRMPFAQAFMRVWVPLLVRIGEKAMAEKGVWIAIEHFAVGFIRREVEALASAGSPGSAPWIALASPEGELHELGMLAAACALEQEGVRVLYLGVNLPESSAERALIGSGLTRLSLTLTREFERKRLKRMLERLRRRVKGARVYLAGVGAMRHANLIQAHGGVFLGADLPLAVARLKDEFSAP